MAHFSVESSINSSVDKNIKLVIYVVELGYVLFRQLHRD